MFTALSIFFKNKLSSPAAIFILIFVVIFGIFIFSNTNVILSKFGFETTTNLKAELTKSQEQLEQLSKINTNLNNTINEMREQHKKELEEIQAYNEELKASQKKITEITNNRKEKAKPIIHKLNQNTVTTEGNITMPIQEYDQLSANNIDAVTAAYNELQVTDQ